MVKGKADLVDSSGAVVAVFNETSHKHGATNLTVRLRSPLAPFELHGTESLALYAESVAEAVLSVSASDPAGTEIFEFHGKSAIGPVPKGTGGHWLRAPEETSARSSLSSPKEPSKTKRFLANCPDRKYLQLAPPMPWARSLAEEPACNRRVRDHKVAATLRRLPHHGLNAQFSYPQAVKFLSRCREYCSYVWKFGAGGFYLLQFQLHSR